MSKMVIKVIVYGGMGVAVGSILWERFWKKIQQRKLKRMEKELISSMEELISAMDEFVSMTDELEDEILEIE